jgi:uncharacterized membrane protein YfcA
VFSADPTLVLAAVFAFALGGVLKGATGAGAPVVAVPVLAALFGVQFAVAVFVVPNLLTNIWQVWQYRKSLLPWQFVGPFAGGGALGAIAGTYLLAGLPSETLSIIMAMVILGYVAFRLFNAEWALRYPTAVRMAGPAGIIGGALQGATGISAPVSVTFLNAMKLPRSNFIATISVFFGAMSVTQIERLVALDLMNLERFLAGLAATATILVVMPLGTLLAKGVSQRTFDKILLGLLVVIALKILYQTLV